MLVMQVLKVHRTDSGRLDRLAMGLLRLISRSRLGLQIIVSRSVDGINLVDELKETIRNSLNTKFRNVCGDLVSYVGLFQSDS